MCTGKKFPVTKRLKDVNKIKDIRILYFRRMINYQT